MEHLYRLDYKNIAKKIKAARKSANLTQAELAEKIDISTNAVAKLENNLMTPSLQTLINIANILDLDINYLLKDDQTISKEETYIDMLLNTLISNLASKDKEFMIHIINGLKLYYSSNK
jgi:transcriptional regulator with XRE-family HTH domain